MKKIFSIYIIFMLAFFILVLNSCKKDNNTPIKETGTMIDIDANVYKTVKIGNQWWMSENLKVKRYRNGDTIQFVSESNFYLDSAKWNNVNSGAFCITASSDSTSQNYQGKMFGLLYNWFTIADARNIAPIGWHIPSDEEWKTLEKYLGMNPTEAEKMSWRGNNEGNKLKVEGPKGWKIPSNIYEVYGTNESGFSAIGGGCCMYNGIWGNPVTFTSGFWWTSTTYENKPLYRYLDYNKSNIFRYYGPKTYGFSIRCVKD